MPASEAQYIIQESQLTPSVLMERGRTGETLFSYLPELVARCAGHSIAGDYYSSAVVEV